MSQLETINPATEEPIQSYDVQSWDEVKSSIERCQSAFEDWRLNSHEERGEVLKAIAAKFREKKENLAQLMTREVGKLLRDSRDEVELCAAICEWTAENGPKELADDEREYPDGRKGVVTYSPIGVVYGIQPWNFPAYQVVRYSIASLMAGNGVLLKHAENCTGSGLAIKDIYEEAGLPEDLFTVLLVDHDTSNKVIEHDLVRGVTLTGSDGAGRAIGELAAQNIKKTVLELGSNDAYMVLEDADVAHAAKTCIQGRLYNNGQTCINAKRFIVTEAVYDEFMEHFVSGMEAIKLGDPTSDDSDMGPMARKDLRETLQKQVDQSVERGAKIRCGGEMREGTGYYYPATVLEDVAPGQPAYDDELFGPVASVIRAKDDEDAIRLANDSRYGLGGGIFTKDLEKAKRIASQHFDTGMVFINGFGLANPNMPFGGVKNSGYGREHGGSGMREFVNEKSIFVNDA
ncbi:NAD-dependent succinate-semialdehyde dehydrogenase [Erythrobacter sp. HKB08]|uniref:NAD-dependent succinate-semialdehyde dehydrogenase n=1 Tax=Erythrobacter sp. HKB08 TaxID=2502843 RepID=UPI001008BA97|nr:NAD-dependent succinate-semialdehyde dehydrogenase [Erythrobacter sp. HKB08]